MKILIAYAALISAFALQGAGCIIGSGITPHTYTDASYQHAESFSGTAKDFIKNYGELVRSLGKSYELPPELILAVAMYESGFGQSKLSLYARNFHGIKAGDNWQGLVYISPAGTRWRAWNNTNEAFEGFCQYICERVPRFIGVDVSPSKFAHAYGCANPKHYAADIEKIIHKYRLKELYQN